MSVSSSRAKKAVKRCYIFPLNVDSDCLGHVYVERRDPNWEPSDSKIRFLALLAREAGLLLEKTRLLEDRRIAKDLQQELNEARKIQNDLFPRTLTLDHRLDIAACNQPCFSVSGDYYDCQLVSPGKIAFIIADVMGHGMKAAMLMAQLQVTFRMGIRGSWELDELDRRLDEVMAVASEGVIFATGILGTCDLENNVLSLISAGHPWPSILNQGERVAVLEGPSEFPWGLSQEVRRVCATTIAISRRWSLLGYTDGLTEARDELDSQYTTKRLEKIHLQNLNSSAEDLCEVVLDDVLGHIGSSTFPKDDMTLLAICRSE